MFDLTYFVEQSHFFSSGFVSLRIPPDKLAELPLGQLKAKLAKLKRELLTPQSSGGGGGCEFVTCHHGL